MSKKARIDEKSQFRDEDKGMESEKIVFAGIGESQTRKGSDLITPKLKEKQNKTRSSTEDPNEPWYFTHM